MAFPRPYFLFSPNLSLPSCCAQARAVQDVSANCGKFGQWAFGDMTGFLTDSLSKTWPDLAQPSVILNRERPAGFQKAAEPACVTSEQKESY